MSFDCLFLDFVLLIFMCFWILGTLNSPIYVFWLISRSIATKLFGRCHLLLSGRMATSVRSPRIHISSTFLDESSLGNKFGASVLSYSLSSWNLSLVFSTVMSSQTLNSLGWVNTNESSMYLIWSFEPLLLEWILCVMFQYVFLMLYKNRSLLGWLTIYDFNVSLNYKCLKIWIFISPVVKESLIFKIICEIIFEMLIF